MSSLLEYSNTEFGFSLNYPSDWEIMENQFGMVVSILGPLTNPLFRTNVGVSAQDLSLFGGAQNLEQVLQVTLASVKQVMTKFKIADKPKDTQLSGKPAKLFSYTAMQGKIKMKIAVVLTLHNGMVYSVAMGSTVDEFKGFSSVINTTLNSFKLL